MGIFFEWGLMPDWAILLASLAVMAAIGWVVDIFSRLRFAGTFGFVPNKNGDLSAGDRIVKLTLQQLHGELETAQNEESSTRNKILFSNDLDECRSLKLPLSRQEDSSRRLQQSLDNAIEVAIQYGYTLGVRGAGFGGYIPNGELEPA